MREALDTVGDPMDFDGRVAFVRERGPETVRPSLRDGTRQGPQWHWWAGTRDRFVRVTKGWTPTGAGLWRSKLTSPTQSPLSKRWRFS